MVSVFDRQISRDIADVVVVNDRHNLGGIEMADGLVDCAVVGQGNLSLLVISGMVAGNRAGDLPLAVDDREGTDSRVEHLGRDFIDIFAVLECHDILCHNLVNRIAFGDDPGDVHRVMRGRDDGAVLFLCQGNDAFTDLHAAGDDHQLHASFDDHFLFFGVRGKQRDAVFEIVSADLQLIEGNDVDNTVLAEVFRCCHDPAADGSGDI